MTSSHRNAVVIGGEADIGLATVTALADSGHDVLFLAADPSAAPAGITVDPGDERAVAAVARGCADRWEALHLLVNCHFAVEAVTVEESAPAVWERALRVNLLGPLTATQAFLPLLKKAGGAAVVHVGSVDGLLGNPAVAAYSVSKGGLVPLTHLMAYEFAGYGIRVNTVARAMVSSAAFATPDDRANALLAATPLRRPASAQEVAAVIEFLASDAASYVTGAVIPVDGGRIGVTPGTV